MPDLYLLTLIEPTEELATSVEKSVKQLDAMQLNKFTWLIFDSEDHPIEDFLESNLRDKGGYLLLPCQMNSPLTEYDIPDKIDDWLEET